MNAIEIIKQNAKMWLGPKYSNKEYEIFKEGVEPFAKRLIKEILESYNDEKKAPRTGFPRPTEKEVDKFLKILKICDNEARIPQSFFFCPIHKRTKLTKFKSKKGNGQVCIKCIVYYPELIK